MNRYGSARKSINLTGSSSLAYARIGQALHSDCPARAGLRRSQIHGTSPNLSDLKDVVDELDQWHPSLYPNLSGTDLRMAGRHKGPVGTISGISWVYTDVFPLEVVQLCDKDCEDDCGGKCGKTCDGEHYTTIGRGPSVGTVAALRLDVKSASTG